MYLDERVSNRYIGDLAKISKIFFIENSQLFSMMKAVDSRGTKNMKQMDLLGIHLKDYNTKESIKMATNFLKSGALNTISYVSTQILVEAAEHPEQKTWIEEMDMTICGEADILRASGINNKLRYHEVENDDFMKEFMKKLVRLKKSVYVIANTENNLENLRSELLEYQPNLQIVGTSVIENQEIMEDALINEINDIVPGVIISCIPFPYQEEFMSRNKKRINAEVWLGLMEHRKSRKKARIANGKITMYFYKRLFRKRVSKYQSDKPE